MKSAAGGSRKASRSKSGFTLPGVAAVLMFMSIVALLLTALSMNIYAYSSYHGKAQIIAEELAKLVGYHGYFLGARRPQFQASASSKHQQLAEKYAAALSSALGLPEGSQIEVSILPESGDNGLQSSKVQVTLKNLSLPFAIPGVLPSIAELDAVGVSSESSEKPPAFIRLGYKLNDPSISNPSVTDATQVVMLPAYGFQTDIGAVQNLGGTQNNNDVVGNQPDPAQCLWLGLNGSPGFELCSTAPYVTGPDGRQITVFN